MRGKLRVKVKVVFYLGIVFEKLKVLGSPQTSLSLDFLVPTHSEHPENIFAVKFAVIDCLG